MFSAKRNRLGQIAEEGRNSIPTNQFSEQNENPLECVMLQLSDKVISFCQEEKRKLQV
jgi:hypothetical protein